MAFKTNLTAGLRSATFPASGSFVVPPGVTNLIVTGCGGGGGGGGGAGGNSYPGTCCGNTYCGQGGVGGGGVYPYTYNLSVTPGQTVPVTVGAGGTAGNGGGTNAPGTSGGNGGTSKVVAVAKVNQVQRIVFTGTPTSGTWQPSFRGVYTSTLAHNISAASLQTALLALSTIGAGEVTVTGSVAAGFDVTFQNALGGVDWGVIFIASNTLSPATTITASILTPGVAERALNYEAGLGGAGGGEGVPGNVQVDLPGQSQTETAKGTVRTESGGGGGGGKGSSSYLAAVAATPSSGGDTNFSTGGVNGLPQYNLAGGGGGGAGIGNGGNGCQPYYANFTTASEPASTFSEPGGYGAGGGGGCGDYNGTASRKNGSAGGSGLVVIFY